MLVINDGSDGGSNGDDDDDGDGGGGDTDADAAAADDDDDSYIHIFIYSYIHIFIYSYIHTFIYSYIHILFCVQTLFSTTMNHTMDMALLNMMPWTWPTEVSCIPGTGAGNRGRLADYCRITASE